MISTQSLSPPTSLHNILTTRGQFLLGKRRFQIDQVVVREFNSAHNKKGRTLVRLHLLAKKKASLLSHLPPYKKIKEDKGECSICQQSLKKGEFERTLYCKHTFHKKCIDKWLRKDSRMSCPLCRLSQSKIALFSRLKA